MYQTAAEHLLQQLKPNQSDKFIPVHLKSTSIFYTIWYVHLCSSDVGHTDICLQKYFS